MLCFGWRAGGQISCKGEYTRNPKARTEEQLSTKLAGVLLCKMATLAESFLADLDDLSDESDQEEQEEHGEDGDEEVSS